MASRLADAGLAQDKVQQEEEKKILSAMAAGKGADDDPDLAASLASLAGEMEAEFRSNRNCYDAGRRLDDFNLPREDVVVLDDGGGAGSDGGVHRICRWFRESGRCYKGSACEDLHVYTGPGSRVDGVPVLIDTVAHHELALPRPGSVLKGFWCAREGRSQPILASLEPHQRLRH